MPEIHILDNITIDKIAAGEVVERPASVAKELIENAIDAGAKSITVEIKDGGISLLRVTDSGCGIDANQIKKAFLRHATSKITTAEDLNAIGTLGFRGEALASICAVAMVEMITKTKNQLTGTHYVIEGGEEKLLEEVGAPDGTTIIVRNLFYNTPARQKFLKKPQTEGAYIEDLMEHLALSHPDISFQFIKNKQVSFSTSGNGDLKEVIYRIYGREIANSIREFCVQNEELGVKINGYIGEPHVNRSNRGYEVFFINGRYIKSNLLSKAVEDGYLEYLMIHKFPVCILSFHFDPELVDVNVHPAKMEVRISNAQAVYQYIVDTIHEYLQKREMIPEVNLVVEKEITEIQKKKDIPENFEEKRIAALKQNEPIMKDVAPSTKVSYLSEKYKKRENNSNQSILASNALLNKLKEESVTFSSNVNDENKLETKNSSQIDNHEMVSLQKEKPQQLNLFEEKIVSQTTRQRYRIVGQVFDTYWLIEYDQKLMILDQHAAHEKVKYERFMKQYMEQNIASQQLNPPYVISLTPHEAEILKEHLSSFQELGFQIEDFGGNEYTIRSTPMELYGANPTDLFQEILSDLEQTTGNSKTPETILMRIATMACKAAVKGNNRMSFPEMEKLLDELLTLENPYHCPHGRPTIITMSKTELEKKFKRIVD